MTKVARQFFKIILVSTLWVGVPSVSWADCSGSLEGTIEYNTDDDRLEFCDYNNWRPLKYDKSIENLTSVYSQDFEGAVGGSEWGTDFSATLTSFLGRFGVMGNQQGPAKTFNPSGTQDTVTIDFDMYRLDDWTNHSFMVYIDDVEVISESYNNQIYIGSTSGTSGAITWTKTAQFPLIFDMAYGSEKDGIYHYSLSIPNTASSIKLGFGTTLVVDSTIASFGIDNLVIDEVNSGTPTNIVTNDFESGVPADDWGNGNFIIETSNFLGEYGDNDGAQLPAKTITISGPPIDSTEIQFDALIFGSWDSEPFNVYFDDVLVYSYNFPYSYVTPPGGSSGSVSWTVTPLYTQQLELNGDYTYVDKAYTYTFSYTNPGASDIKIGFGSGTNESVSNESLGIDNITVSKIISAIPTVIYSEDFESGVPADDWGSDVSFSFGSFLGRFGDTAGQGPNRTFTLPGGQTETTLTFDLYEIDSTENEAFSLYIDDISVYSFNFTDSIYDQPTTGSAGAVSWTVSNLTPVAFDIDYSDGSNDQAYRYIFTISNSGNTSIKVGFGASLNSGVTNESFGIDNLTVEHDFGGGAIVYTSDFNSGLDEMSWEDHTPETNVVTGVLGRFAGTGGAQGVNRTFTLSGSQDTTTIEFDFLELETWDNEDFVVYLDDALLFTQSSIQLNEFNSATSGSSGNVTWAGSNKSFSNRNMVNTYGGGGYRDQSYRYVITITNPGATSVKIGYGSTTNESTDNESFAIDNFQIYETASGSPTTVYEDDFEGTISGWSDNSQFFDYGLTTVKSRTITDSGLSVTTIYTNNETETNPGTYQCTPTEFGASTTTFLGRLEATGGGQGSNKTFTLPGTQEYTRLTFDFVETGTWDNERFYIWVNDTLIANSVFNTNYNVPTSGTTGNVYWRVNNISPLPLTFLGFSVYDQIYRYTLYVDNPGETSIKLGFGSNLTESLSNESFGIDNVEVEHFDSTAQSSVAVCSNEGEFYWDGVLEAMVYCDGTGLWPFANPSSGSGGCTAPVGQAGELEYDTTTKNFKYCDGNGWVESENW